MVGYFNTYIQRYWEDNQKVQTYTELGLSLFLMVVFLAFAIRPTLATVLELNKKLHEARQANQRLDEKIRSISLAQANLAEIEPRLELVEEAVPKRILALDFLNQVQLLAGEYNLALTKLSYNQANAALFLVEGKGSYPDLKQFLSHLEQLPRLVNIRGLVLSTKQDEFEFSLEGEVYSREQNE